ncbi:MAG TPA: catalase [Kofleriaceae bacterium]|jgi:catalase|nr:catalase [Kofleriaceae bacterium]
MSSEPSTQWHEEVAPDEEVRFTRLAEQLRELQRRHTRRRGAGRALHRKGHIGVEASFEVLGDLPAPARQGLFAKPGRYRAYVRFSNGASAHQADGKGDVRGIAIKVIGVEGTKIIPGLESAPTQDFLMNQPAVTPFRDPDEFVTFVRAAANPATALPKLLFGVGPRRLFAVGGALRRSLSIPVESLAAITFHSALPVRWGDYAGKYRLTPVAPARVAANGGGRRGSDYLATELGQRLAAGPLGWDFAVQLYRDPVATPIEDSTVLWSDDAAPPVVVARLVIEQQEITSDRGRAIAAFIEKLAFDPWHALVEHRPLGAMMRARNHAYRLSTAERGAAAEPDGSETF